MESLPTLVLLPGMHGTDDLFGPFLSVLPIGVRSRVITFPTEQILDYHQLLELIENQLTDERDIVIVGESYSGPLALEFAANHPDRVRAAVLSASFVRPPLPSPLRYLIHPFLCRIPLPSFIIRFFVAGYDSPQQLVTQIGQAIRKPSPVVLAHRAREVLSVDCTESLRSCTVPILYLLAKHDNMVRRFCVRAILKIRPDVQVAEIDGPHLILQTRPAEAWRAIERFLHELSQPKSPRTV